jgi:tetratricopeptide (TPR) repeat protein
VISIPSEETVRAAIAAIESESASVGEKIEMLIEIANDLQQKPKDIVQLEGAIDLYRHAIDLCAHEYPHFKGRAMVGMAIAFRMLPEEGAESLLNARELLERGLPLLLEHASPEEIAEARMNLGLVLQSLVPFHQAKLTDSLQYYQQALQVFTPEAYPREYAILQNNIGIAYLSLPTNLEGGNLREGMAVQTFECALQYITLIDHPSEYAMLQNNLGNALQYASSTHPVENNWRAVQAYDEALKVRTAQDTPLEYANTIANKANVLGNLADDAEHPEAGNRAHLQQARLYYQEALQLFRQYGQFERAETVEMAIGDIDRELEVCS